MQARGKGSPFPILRSRDPEGARDALSRAYKPHEMACADGARGFDFLHMSARIPQGSFNILRYGAEVQISPGSLGDFYMLELPLSGGVTLSGERGPIARSGPDTALFIPPGLQFTSVWSTGCVQMMLKLRSSEVLARWQAALGDPAAGLPQAQPEIDLTTPQGWRVRQMMALLKSEAERAVSGQADLLSETPLAGAVLDTVIAYLRDIHGPSLDPGYPKVLPARLKRCLAVIEDGLAGQVSVGMLAAAAGGSERSLFDLFAAFLNTTPMAHVQDRRLARARLRLLAGEGPVSHVTLAVGLHHPGRFSQAYFRKYGEKPSETLAAAIHKPQVLSTR